MGGKIDSVVFPSGYRFKATDLKAEVTHTESTILLGQIRTQNKIRGHNYTNVHTQIAELKCKCDRTI